MKARSRARAALVKAFYSMLYLVKLVRVVVKWNSNFASERRGSVSKHRFWRTFCFILRSEFAGTRWNTAMDVSTRENFNSMPESSSERSATDETVMWFFTKIERVQVTVDSIPIWWVEPRLRYPQLSLL